MACLELTLTGILVDLSERNKLVTKLKREIVKVRRQLALQKGERLLSDDDDVMSPVTANESTASEAEEDKSQDDDGGDKSSPERQVVQVSAP